jgi:hypothetical protein
MSAPIQKLDAAGYRKFGLTTGLIIAVLFGAALPWLFDLAYRLWPWILAGVLAGLGLILPMVLQPIYIVWMKFGNVMNWINTRIILGILFYLIFLPIGMLMRLFGKDSMHRKLDKTLSSYRVISQNEDKDNVERPY